MSLFKEKLELKIEEAEFKTRQKLGDFAPWQRWIIIGCLIAFIPAYFIAKIIGNAYFEKQYKQYLIEARPSFSNPKPLLIDRLDLASMGENEFAAVAQVVNQNLDLAAKNVPYEMKFLAKDGSEAASSQRGQFYLLPNQRKYLVAPRIVSSSGVVLVNLILPENIAWQRKLELPKVELVASQPKSYDQLSPLAFVVEGGLTNNSAYSLKEAKLIFLLFGTGGKIIGASQRSEFDLKPFERRDYKQIWSNVSGVSVIRPEVIAETNLLDKDNLTAPEFETGGGAGNLDR